MQNNKALSSKVNFFTKHIRIILIVLSTATFGQFIIEEAIQNYGFGVGSMFFAKTYQSNMREAVASLDRYEQFHNGCQGIMYALYLGNPVTAVWFQKFMESNKAKITEWRKVLAEVSKNDWKANVSTNTYSQRSQSNYKRSDPYGAGQNYRSNNGFNQNDRPGGNSGGNTAPGRGNSYSTGNSEVNPAYNNSYVYTADWGRVIIWRKKQWDSGKKYPSSSNNTAETISKN